MPRKPAKSSQKAPTINRKRGKNCDSNNKVSSIISKHFPLFFLDRFLIMVLLKNGPSRDRFLILFRFYICCKFQIEYLKNSFWTDSNIFFLAEMQQQHFFPNLPGKGQPQKWPTIWQYTPYPPPPPQKESLMQPPCKFGQCTTILQSPLSFKFKFISDYFDAIIQAWKLLGVFTLITLIVFTVCQISYFLTYFFCTSRPFTERIYEEKKMREKKVDWNVSKMKIPTLISFKPQVYH